MTRFRLKFSFALISLFLVALPAKADELAGIWLDSSGTIRVRIAPCSIALCGSIIWLGEPRQDSFNPDEKKRSQSLMGRRIFWDVTADEKTGEWKGQFYNPDDGRTYNASIRIEGGKLMTQGCVTGSLACINAVWARP